MKPYAALLPLVLAACVAQQGPKFTPMARTPAAVPADDPAATSNPLHYEIHPRPRTKAASLEALRVANASAMRTVTDGTFKGAALRMLWDDGNPTQLYVGFDRVMSIQLEPGEAYINHAIGTDHGIAIYETWAGTHRSGSQQDGPARTVIPVVGNLPGRCTDLTIYTTARILALDVCVVGRNQPYNRIVSFPFAGDDDARAAARLRAQNVPMEPRTGVPVDQLDTNWKAAGGPASWRASDWQVMSYGKGRQIFMV